MYCVNPCQVELFHLRLLLLSCVKGKQSFLATFCSAMDLIENDDEWRRAISEGAAYMICLQF